MATDHHIPRFKSQYDNAMFFLAEPSNSRIDTACRYLESKGLRFLVEFGLDNAESLMWAMAEEE